VKKVSYRGVYTKVVRVRPVSKIEAGSKRGNKGNIMVKVRVRIISRWRRLRDTRGSANTAKSILAHLPGSFEHTILNLEYC
jgi:hypothetical protein